MILRSLPYLPSVSTISVMISFLSLLLNKHLAQIVSSPSTIASSQSGQTT